jgi:hypothetical protein
LLTCEHQTSAGAYRLKLGYALADLQHWDERRYLLAGLQLVEADLIHVDNEVSCVLITRWFRHNPPMNESHFKGVAKVIQKLPSLQLKEEALDSLEQAFSVVRAAKASEQGKSPPAPARGLGPDARGYATGTGFGSR